jgi:predicted short-subunit dehydrogenase-like oxidoreductase (DUF2520 family)
MQKIQKISFIGFGLVAQTLSKYLQSKGLEICQIVVRKMPAQKLEKVSFVTEIKDLKPVDLVIICVNDDALADLVQQIPETQLAVHTSGSIGLETLGSRKNLAVFYPLQSFAHLRSEAVPEIPILLEAPNQEVFDTLQHFALQHFQDCRDMNSEARAKLHLTAVFANNFTNHLIHLAQKQCEENNLPFELLKPLIAETADKWIHMNAADLQTGPAVRGDENVIQKHLAALSGEMQTIYKTLTESIQNEKNSQ